MRMIADKKWLLLALVLALAVPTQSYALSSSWLSQWWSRATTEPIADVAFTEATTNRARLTQITINRFRIRGTERLTFDEVDVVATVAAGVITFEDIVLTEGTTTATIVIDPATLKTDVLGSSFKANATITVVGDDSTTEFEGVVRGRIATRNGVYYLSAALVGNSITRISSGNYVISLLTLSLTGEVDEPIEDTTSAL